MGRWVGGSVGRWVGGWVGGSVGGWVGGWVGRSYATSSCTSYTLQLLSYKCEDMMAKQFWFRQPQDVLFPNQLQVSNAACLNYILASSLD